MKIHCQCSNSFRYLYWKIQLSLTLPPSFPNMCLASGLLLSEAREKNTWVLYTVLYSSFSVPHVNNCSVFCCTLIFVLILCLQVFALEMVELSVLRNHSSLLIHNKILNLLSGKNWFLGKVLLNLIFMKRVFYIPFK